MNHDVDSSSKLKGLLIEALSYIQRFQGKIMVIKYGGAAMIEKKYKQSFAEDILLLQSLGMQPVIVHGGGPEVSRAMEQLGQQVNFVEGLRVTNAENLKVSEMVLSGTINKEIITHLNTCGGKAVGLSGKDGYLIEATKKTITEGVDLGYVGEIVETNPELLKVLIREGFIPVISPIGLGRDGTTYNINADTTAAHIAVALQAMKLIFMTDVQGILRKEKLCSELKYDEALSLINLGTITDGMKPKVEAGVFAVMNGVESAQIIRGTDPHSVKAELFTDKGIGTKIIA